MIEVLFQYQDTNVTIQCDIKDKFKDILNKYYIKVEIKEKSKLYFLYDAKVIDEELTLEKFINNADKEKKKIIILVEDPNSRLILDNQKYKSEDIICPKCNELSLLNIKDYKINLFDCKNGHSSENILLTEFENTKMIDASKIQCIKCKVKNIVNIFNNEMYICSSCNIILCPLCMISHEKRHTIIKYKEKDYICFHHNEDYIKYCTQCKINLCMKCEKEHKTHNFIYYGDILPNEEKIKKDIEDLRQYIDNCNKIIQEIIYKLNLFTENIELYYNICNEIVNAYERKKRNYQVLQNIKEFEDYNNIISKDLEKIIKSDNIFDKLDYIMNISYKINHKNTNDKLMSEKEKKIEELKSELKKHENMIENKDKKIKELDERIKTCNNTLEDMKRNLDEKDKLIKELIEKKISLETIIKDNKEKNNEFNDKNKSLLKELEKKEKEIDNLKLSFRDKEQESNKFIPSQYFPGNENQPNYSFKRSNTFQPNFNVQPFYNTQENYFQPQYQQNQYPQIIPSFENTSQEDLITVSFHEQPFTRALFNLNCYICGSFGSGYYCQKSVFGLCDFCFEKIKDKVLLYIKTKHPHSLYIKINNYDPFKCDSCGETFRIKYFFYCKECKYNLCLVCLYDDKKDIGQLGN